MSDYDAILVPGGGVREGGTLPARVRHRLDLAAQLRGKSYIVTLSAGSPHRPPPLTARGFPIFESVAAAKYLIQCGVPRDRILTETISYDTIGNAFFSRVVHIDPQRLSSLLVITSNFHLRRVQETFNWIYALTPTPRPYELGFRGVDDSDMDRAVLRARQEKERIRLAMLKPLTQRLTTMNAFHRWLFTEHWAYESLARGFDDGQESGPVLDSY